MATIKPSTDAIIGTAKALAEARASFKAENAVRTASKTLLKPDEVAGGYDVGRALMTTMGGTSRVLTIDDLKQFAFKTRKIKAQHKKGITAKGVIDLSLPVDRKRANEEIKTAVPISATGASIKFMTNSGPNSDRQRHYVSVDVRNFAPVVASAINVDKCGHELVKSPLAVSCSCGRWRYWLAYVATAGGYNSGPREDAFPKIRNAGLAGVACKHVLRVMALFSQSPYMKTYLSNMVRKARDRVEDVREDAKVADTRKLAEQLKKESYRQRQIKTSDEKRQARITTNQREALAKAATKAPGPKKVAPSTRKASVDFAKKAQEFGLTPEQMQALFASAMKTK